MPQVKIYQPFKGATQSGRAKMGQWVLEYILETKRQPEALMGWIASGDALNEVRIGFATREEAVAFAEKKVLAYEVIETHPRHLKGRTYMDNFRYTPPEKI